MTGAAACLYREAGISRPGREAYAPSVGGDTRQRALQRIEVLSRHGKDLVTFWREATEVLRPVVPFYETPCFYTLDPASLLATSHYHDGLPEIPPE